MSPSIAARLVPRHLPAAVLLMAIAAPLAAQEHTLRVHSFGSPTSLDHTAHLDRWAEAVEDQSGGRIAVEVYPSLQLGGGVADLMTQLDDGIVDIVWTLPGFTPGRFPDMQGLELPFMHTGSSATMSLAAMEFVTEHLAEEFEGIHVISIHATDAAIIHTPDEPVDSLEDLDGMKLRMAGRFIGEGVKGLGATPVGMGLGKIYEAVSRGQVDGFLINWSITEPFRFREVVDYHTDAPLFQSMLMTLMRQESYDALPPDLQAVIDANSGVEYATRMGEIWDTATEPARRFAVENGDTLVTLTDGEVARWKAADQPAYDAWIAARWTAAATMARPSSRPSGRSPPSTDANDAGSHPAGAGGGLRGGHARGRARARGGGALHGGRGAGRRGGRAGAGRQRGGGADRRRLRGRLPAAVPDARRAHRDHALHRPGAGRPAPRARFRGRAADARGGGRAHLAHDRGRARRGWARARLLFLELPAWWGYAAASLFASLWTATAALVALERATGGAGSDAVARAGGAGAGRA